MQAFCLFGNIKVWPRIPPLATDLAPCPLYLAANSWINKGFRLKFFVLKAEASLIYRKSL